MEKLVQKVNYNLPNSPSQQLYMYGEASVEANQEMQEPLEKLYQYENQLDMKEKIREYISGLNAEVKRLESQLEKYINEEAYMVTKIEEKMSTLIDVKNNLQGILDEVINGI